MRLIDAEKIEWEYKCISKEEIEEEPTVIAIPWSEVCKILYDRPDDHAQIRQKMYEWLWENDSEFRDRENKWWAEHSSRFD